MTATITNSSCARMRPFLLAVPLGWAAFHWLSERNVPIFPINDDAIRDQLLARDCADLARCHLLGAPASFGGLHHGAIWIEVLSIVRWLGGDVAMQRTTVLALLASSVVILFVFVWRWLRPSMALPAAVLLLVALSFDTPGSLLINPSIAVFPDILTAAGLLCFGLTRRWRFLLVSAFALGVGMSMHTASLGLVAPLLTIAALARPSPWRTALTAATIVVAVYAIPSSATFRANVIALAAQNRLVAVLAGAVIVILVASRFGASFRRLSWNARAWIIGIILVVPFALTLLWLVAGAGHHFAIIYLHPLLAPAAVCVSASVCLPFERAARRVSLLRWWPTLAAAVLLASVVFDVWRPTITAPSAEATTWDLARAEIVARYALRRGWAWEDLVFHLQGSACRELLTGMSLAAPPAREPTSARERQLQVVMENTAAVDTGAGTELIPLGTGVATMKEVASWLRPLSLKACRVPIDAGALPRCGVATPPPADTLTPERFLFIARSFPLIENLDVQRPYVATYEIPLAPRAGESREVSLTDDDTLGCGWRITRVEGVRIEETLPARRVRLHATGDAAGLIAFAKPFGTDGCPAGDIDTHYPPCVLEVPLNEPSDTGAGV